MATGQLTDLRGHILAAAEHIIRERGLRAATTRAIVARAGANAAAGSVGAAGRRSAVGQAILHSFVHAIHIGTMVAIGFMVLASVVSVLFVRSHVGLHAEPETVAGPDERRVAVRGH